jgi:branched-chain amino acid transport system permease protein
MSGIISYLIFFLTVALIYSLATLGLNLHWGNTGLFNIGVVGFYAIGAYTYGLLVTPPSVNPLGHGLPLPIGFLGAMLISGFFAFLIGLPTLRLRDDYLAIATIGIATTIQLFAINAQSITGGTNGLYGIPQPLQHVLQHPAVLRGLAFLVLVAFSVLIVYLALERMVRSPWGRVLVAIREDETAASSLGKDAFNFRLQSFVIGSMIMGLAGAFYAAFIQFIGPADFQPIFTFQVWTMLIVGGSGSNLGALVGSLLIWALWTGSGTLIQAILPASLQVKGGAVQIILIGLVLMMVLIFRPRGLLGNQRRGFLRARKVSEES